MIAVTYVPEKLYYVTAYVKRIQILFWRDPTCMSSLQITIQTSMLPITANMIRIYSDIKQRMISLPPCCGNW